MNNLAFQLNMKIQQRDKYYNFEEEERSEVNLQQSIGQKAPSESNKDEKTSEDN